MRIEQRQKKNDTLLAERIIQIAEMESKKLNREELTEATGGVTYYDEYIDFNIMKEPSFMIVLCGVAPFAYRRKDGVLVVPIGCLKP